VIGSIQFEAPVKTSSEWLKSGMRISFEAMKLLSLLIKLTRCSICHIPCLAEAEARFQIASEGVADVKD
jgi:hypothetical protein